MNYSNPNHKPHMPVPQRHPAKRTRPTPSPDPTKYWTGRDAQSSYTPADYVVPRTSDPGAGFNDDDLILPQADSKGATIPLKCKITPAMERSISAVLESRRFPFACQADFIRAAVLRLLKDCSAMSAEGTTLMTVVQSQMDTGRKNIMENEMANLLDITHGHYLLLIQEGEYQAAQEEADKVLERIKSCPASVWQRRMLRHYYERFPNVLDRSQGNPLPGIKARVVAMPPIQHRTDQRIAVGQNYEPANTNSNTYSHSHSHFSTNDPNSPIFHRRVLMRFNDEHDDKD